MLNLPFNTERLKSSVGVCWYIVCFNGVLNSHKEKKHCDKKEQMALAFSNIIGTAQIKLELVSMTTCKYGLFEMKFILVTFIFRYHLPLDPKGLLQPHEIYSE